MMRVFFLSLWIVMIATDALGQALDQIKVDFVVTDVSGNTIPRGVTITIIPDSEGATPSVAIDYPDVKWVQLPKGSYTVIDAAKNFLRRTQHLMVADKDLFVPLPLLVAPAEPASIVSRVSGQIGERLRGKTPMWLRLVGLYSEFDHAIKVD